MKIRRAAPQLIVIAFGGISPALADCCSSFLDCAAAVVTDGLSCEVETIISTIKTLVSLTSNLLSDVNGQTQAAENSARQAGTDVYNSLQSTSQKASADLAQAKTQADQLYREESALLPKQAYASQVTQLTATKLAIALKTIQPVQRPVLQPAAVQAPSSMTPNP